MSAEIVSMKKQKPLSMPDLIEEARRQRSNDLSVESRVAVEAHRGAFDRARITSPRTAGLNIFVFHVPVPAEATKLAYNDLNVDHAEFDYERIIEHFLTMALSHDSNCFVYLVTSAEFADRLVHPRLASVVLDIDQAAPMYERVRAMTAYTQSTAFDAPTSFLDGDAFVNRPLQSAFQAPFDVAVTYRRNPGLMPINEGVIFARAVQTDKVRGFFESYLATYDRLIAHPPIIEHYGDIRRWRGGQLSLNALTCPEGIPAEIDLAEVFGAQIRYLPCQTFNFSIESGRPYTADELDGKYILHLKGLRKQLLETTAAYQISRLKHQEHAGVTARAAEGAAVGTPSATADSAPVTDSAGAPGSPAPTGAFETAIDNAQTTDAQSNLQNLDPKPVLRGKMPVKIPLSQRVLTDVFWRAVLSPSDERGPERQKLTERITALDKLRASAEYNTGSITFGAAWSLYSLVRYFGVERVAEVGTFIGKSATSILSAMDDSGKYGKLYTCDFSNSLEIPWTGVSKFQQFKKTSSTNMFEKLDGVLDFLFLDGRVAIEDLPLIDQLITEDVIIGIDDFEGMEKGVVNASRLSGLAKLKNHVLVYPASMPILLEHGLTTASLTAVLLPQSCFAFVKQEGG